MSERRINGTIVRHCRDNFGEMTVADDGVIRSLYFGDVLQSCIRLDQPAALIDEYNQAIMSSLLFREDPRSVLLVGLGGCSLVNFLLTRFPECTIDAVEIREMVVDIARNHFLLRHDRAHLNIHHAPGQDFVLKKREGYGRYDLIIVDAFDEGGPAARLLEKDFLLACRQWLGEDGVFAMNLWSRPKDNFPALYAAIREAFGKNAMKLAVSESCWNTIAFGFACPKSLADLNARRPAARRLQQKHGINFPKYLKYLYWQNFG